MLIKLLMGQIQCDWYESEHSLSAECVLGKKNNLVAWMQYE